MLLLKWRRLVLQSNTKGALENESWNQLVTLLLQAFRNLTVLRKMGYIVIKLSYFPVDWG